MRTVAVSKKRTVSVARGKAARQKAQAGTGTRRGDRPRRVHRIDEHSSARDIDMARDDLVGFFEDVIDKHHGWNW